MLMMWDIFHIAYLLIFRCCFFSHFNLYQFPNALIMAHYVACWLVVANRGVARIFSGGGGGPRPPKGGHASSAEGSGGGSPRMVKKLNI